MPHSERILTAYMRPDEATFWYPLPPRWIPLLRSVGLLCLLFVIYGLREEGPWSFAPPSRWWAGGPTVFALYCFFVKPKRRRRSFLTHLGRIVHFLLVLLPFASALLVVVHWFRQ